MWRQGFHQESGGEIFWGTENLNNGNEMEDNKKTKKELRGFGPLANYGG
jgi:hypothetical protein